MLIFGRNVLHLYVSRFFSGLVAGGNQICISLYVAEIADNEYVIGSLKPNYHSLKLLFVLMFQHSRSTRNDLSMFTQCGHFILVYSRLIFRLHNGIVLLQCCRDSILCDIPISSTDTTILAPKEQNTGKLNFPFLSDISSF